MVYCESNTTAGVAGLHGACLVADPSVLVVRGGPAPILAPVKVEELVHLFQQVLKCVGGGFAVLDVAAEPADFPGRGSHLMHGVPGVG